MTFEEKKQKLKNEMLNIKLTVEEKRDMLGCIMNSPLPSPYTPVHSTWIFTSKTLTYVFASLLILILSTSSVAYASMSSIPGDKLYTIKVKLTEPILDVVAFTPMLRAKRSAHKAIRRLEEAEKLIAKNELTEEHQKELEKRFKKNTEDFDNEVKIAEENFPIEAKNFKASFDLSLHAHSNLMQEIREVKAETKEIDVKQKNINKKDTNESSLIEKILEERVFSNEKLEQEQENIIDARFY
ncbi:MAG: hypothetical protein M3P22_02810 [bacterium]|nr:hypothetical protein [bacterium]